MPSPLNPVHKSVRVVPSKPGQGQHQNYAEEHGQYTDAQENNNRVETAIPRQNTEVVYSRTHEKEKEVKGRTNEDAGAVEFQLDPKKCFGGHESNSVVKMEKYLEQGEKELVQIAMESSILKEKMSCKDCRAFVARVVYIPCGHMMSCQGCDVKLERRNCQKCNKVIKDRVNVTEDI